VEFLALAQNQIDDDLLGAVLGEEVGLGEHAHGSYTGWIESLGEVENLLRGRINGARDDGEDDGPGVPHVTPDHVVDEGDVVVRGEARSRGPKDTWHVDDGQVILLGAADFDLQDVFAESAQSIVGSPLGANAHWNSVLVLTAVDCFRKRYHGSPALQKKKERGLRTGFVGLLVDLDEVPTGDAGDGAVEVLQALLPIGVRIGTGDDGNGDAPLGVATTGDLRGIPRAETGIARQTEPRQALQDGALAAGLVPHRDELWGDKLEVKI